MSVQTTPTSESASLDTILASAKRIRVYRFPAEPVNEAAAAELKRQLRLASDYRRWLCRLENGERAFIKWLYRQDPRIAAAEDRQDAIFALPPAERVSAEIVELRENLKLWRKERGASEEHRAEVARVRKMRADLARACRAIYSDRGLFWGTYLTVEEAHERACRDTMPWEQVKMRPGWDTVAVQVQSTRPMDGKRLLECVDSRAQLAPELYALQRRSHMTAAVFRRLKLRTGSTGPGNREPIWTELHVRQIGTSRGAKRRDPSHPCAMRHVPPDANITWVRVHRHVIALRERWEVQVVAWDRVAAPAPSGDRHVGIDIGWRRVAGGVRLAVSIDDVGNTHELVVPDTILRRRGKCSDLRSIRDKHQDAAKADILRWREEEDAPAWFREATHTTHAWRKVGRYVRLWRSMTEAKLWPDRALRLEAWLKQDRHLFAWEANNRAKMIREIDGLQRHWISKVLRGAKLVGVEEVLRIDKMRAKATASSEAHRQAAVANVEIRPGAFRELVIRMAGNRGITVRQVNPAYTTATCSACGKIREEADRAEVMVRCEHCGHEEDQDVTASKEILARALAGDVAEQVAKRKINRRTRRAPTKETSSIEP